MPATSDKEALADLYVENRLFANAAAIYAELRAEHPDDGSLGIKLARAFYHDGDFDEALEVLASLEERASPPDGVRELRQSIESDRSQTPLARPPKALSQTPEEWLRAGRTRLAVGRYDAAAEAFERTLEAWPRHFESLRSYGICLSRLGRAKEAAARLRMACECDEAVPETWLLLARASLAAGDEAGARAALDRALELDPRFHAARLEWAAMAAAGGDAESRAKLAEEMRTILDSPPEEADTETRASACWHMARAVSPRAGSDDAVHCLEEALRLAPDFEPALRDLARGRIERGEARAAADLLWRLIERHPDDPQLYADLAARCYAALDAAELGAELDERLRQWEREPVALAKRSSTIARLAVALTDAGRQELLRVAYRRSHRLKNRSAVAVNRLTRWAHQCENLSTEARAELDAVVGELQSILSEWLEALNGLQPEPRRFEALDARAPLRQALSDALLAHPGRFQTRREMGSAPLTVHGDRAALYDVFHNLVKNALQAMSGEGTLTVRCAREGERAAIEIEDTGAGAEGMGASAENLEALFAEGYSTREGGSGYGLPIARYNTRLHGGTLTLRRGAERGLIARVELPLAEA